MSIRPTALAAYTAASITPTASAGRSARGIGRLRSSQVFATRSLIACSSATPVSTRVSSTAAWNTHSNHRSEEHTSELQSLMRNSYAVFCLKKKNKTTTTNENQHIHHKH